MSDSPDLRVPFVQFLRPDGRRRNIWIERDAERARKATALREQGCRFEVEELLTGEASMTVERLHGGEDELVSIRVVPNGPEVPPAVDELIDEAYERVVP